MSTSVRDPDSPVTAPFSPSRLGYRPGIDGIRAVAILGVMVHHANIAKLIGGHVGVSVFFTLSGFLITTLLLEELSLTGRIDVVAFYVRRAARLLPLLLVTLAVACTAMLVTFGSGGLAAIGWGGGSALVYCSNIVGIFKGDVPQFVAFGWAWSLSMEEQFYLLWPALVLLATRIRRAHGLLVAVSVLGVAFSLMQKWRMSFPHGAWNGHLYTGPDTRMDALLFGCLLSLWLQRRAGRERAAPPSAGRLRLREWLAAASGMVGLVCILTTYHLGVVNKTWTYHWGLPLVSLGTMGLILAALDAPRSPVGRLLSLPPLVRVGQISYGLYLWNFVLLFFWQHHTGRLLTHAEAVVWFIVVVVLAEFSYRGLEKPVITRSRRFLRLRAERLEALRRAAPLGTSV